MSSTIVLKAAGLQTSPNELSRDEGALVEASNVIIKRDGILEARRGYSLYGNNLPSSDDRAKQLASYRNRILRHYSNKIQFDSNGSGDFQDLSGTFLETEAGLRMKFAESNGNLYFTTADGIKKISAKTADDLTTDPGFVTNAGAVKAVDLQGVIDYVPNDQTDFLVQDGVVAYRVVWAYNDLNNNLLLGSPSQREIVSNPLTGLLIRDYMRCLDVLDNLVNTPLTSARINDKNYISTLKLTLNSSATDIYTNLLVLASKIDNDIFLADQGAVAPLQITSATITTGVCTVNFTGTVTNYLSAGKKIFLAGFSPAVGTLNGAQTISTVGASTITFNTTATGVVTLASATIYYNEYRSITVPSAPSVPASNQQLVDLQTYYTEILNLLSAEPSNIISAADQLSIDTLGITTAVSTILTITIPEGLDSSYFYQVYRSPVAFATGAAIFEDVVANDELQLVYEAYPTSVELSAGVLVVNDITPDSFRGANLYTNASTGEGILAANEAPPFAKDINIYKNCMFYANTRTKQTLALNLIGVTNMIADYDLGNIPKITVSNGDVTNTYDFITGQQEITSITAVADVADSLNGKYFLINSVSTGYYVYFETTTATDPAIYGRTGIKVKISTGGTAIANAGKLRDKLSLYLDDFIVTDGVTAVVEVTNVDVGETPDATAGTSGFTITNTQQGRGERVQPEVTQVTVIAGNLYTSSGTADYFTLNTTLDQIQYYPWFKAGTATDPALAGKFPLQIDITGAETNSDAATLVKTALDATGNFTTTQVSNVLTITNNQYGKATNATSVVANAGFLVSTTQEGALEVLLSPLASPARAVDETARSFIRVINKNPGETIYGSYLSSSFDVPGQMSLQARTLDLTSPFYVLGNNSNTGLSFNPDISPSGTITSISAANPTVITTSSAHGLKTNDQVMITNSNSIKSVDGLQTVTILSPTTFSIPINITTSGSTGSFILASNGVFSENEEKPNRVYYSKFSQPESVPLVNFFDVGRQDKQIYRIFPLRDSLFIFKEDGLYRISGTSAPFQLNLFDNSYNLLASDSVSVSNNIIYSWTTQGVQSLTEGGAAIISRPIDNIILKTQSSNFTNFRTATWGVGYGSDNSYVVFTVLQMDDTVATIGYRYSTLTQSWTTYDMSPTCGIINSSDDKMYLGASDVAYIEQERKTFSRLDYADRQYDSVISTSGIIDNKIYLPSVTQFAVGDVLVQEQTLNTFQFNTLLDKLDIDSGVADTDYNTLAMIRGNSPRAKIVDLANKLDLDTGVNYSSFFSTINSKTGSTTSIPVGDVAVITSASHGLLTGRQVIFDSTNSSPTFTGPYSVTVIDANTFSVPVKIKTAGTTGNWQTVDSNFYDVKTCYNFIITTLNADTGVSFNNYVVIHDDITSQETIIIDVNKATKTLTVNLELDYLAGAIKIYKAITSAFTYSPNTMGDPLMLKHLREATLMFEVNNITSATMSFKTDLLPQFIEVPFTMAGNGIFGNTPFGEGFFGGIGNSAPFRTYIPRDCQRCRYIVSRFVHSIAREKYSITGYTITGNLTKSTRAYR